MNMLTHALTLRPATANPTIDHKTEKLLCHQHRAELHAVLVWIACDRLCAEPNLQRYDFDLYYDLVFSFGINIENERNRKNGLNGIAVHMCTCLASNTCNWIATNIAY